MIHIDILSISRMIFVRIIFYIPTFTKKKKKNMSDHGDVYGKYPLIEAHNAGIV